MKLILNNTGLICKVILLCGLLYCGLNAGAQFVPETFSRNNTGAQVKSKLTATSGAYPVYLDTVKDDKFALMAAGGSWRTSFKHKSVTDRITISIKDTSVIMGKFNYLFNLAVDTFDQSNNHGSFNIVMNFSYDPASHKAYTDKAVYQFAGAHKFFARITGITDSTGTFSYTTMKTNFNIESEILVERYYLGSYSTAVSSLSRTSAGFNKMLFSWVPPASSAPNQYELEWAYIDTAGIDPDSLRYDFKHNSSRVLLSSASYTINTVYDAGIILYRVRRVKPDSVYFRYSKYSSWLPSDADAGLVSAYSSSYKFYVAGHEGMNKNWDYQVAFAEEGLKKEVVNYFDGSLKRRQGVTLMNTQNFALVDESIYDFHGREAIKIIPAPSDSNTIRYYNRFNRNAIDTAYSARDFDSSTVMANKCDGTYKAKPLGSQSGAGRYYSDDNPDKSGENAAIPDALGYPLVQTQLMPDPTGRVYAQGGVGKTHQLGSGHETKYTYGSASQAELDEVFGSEVGIASHYKRNAVTDPNGQMSISYIDQHGRVVATALTGTVPGMVDTLNNFTAPKYTFTDLSGNARMLNNALVSSYEFDVSNSGIHKIYYKLESPDFAFGCVGLRPCYTCRYNIEVRLDDDCGNKLLHFTSVIGNLADTACNSLEFVLQDSIASILGSVSSSGDSVSFTLNTGHYRLSKILTVNTDSLSGKISEVVAEDTSCYKTFEDFLEEEMNAIDFSDCSCDTCGGDSLSYCESRKQLMMEDVSPGGQYFSYDEETFTPGSDPTSIFHHNGSNYLYKTISASYYTDAEGTPDTVIIDGVAITPNNLTIQQFTEHFQASWAEALLRIHPEYCYYKYCIDSLQASNRYDEAMVEISDYDTAVTYGFFDPLDNRSDYAVSSRDPYFFTGGTLNSRGTSFNTRLNDLSDYTSGTGDILNISLDPTDLWQMAMATGYCENIADPFERESCFKFYTSASVKNNWMNDQEGRDNYWNKYKALYYQAKQKFIEQRMYAYASGTYCVKNIGPTCSNADYRDKISHFVRYEQLNPLEADEDSIGLEEERLLDSLGNLGSCEADVMHWDEALAQCPDYEANRDSILFHLLAVCKAGSTNPNTMNALGTTDIPQPYRTGRRFVSFEAVLVYFLGSDYKSELCNLDLINSPRASGHDLFNQKPTETSACLCDNLKDEIRNFKGCVTIKDSAQLNKDGELVNEFINKVVAKNLLTTSSTILLNAAIYELENVGNNLFGPALGGTAGDFKYKQNNGNNLSNLPSWEKHLTVFKDGTESDHCDFVIRLLNTAKNFDNINPSKSYTIKPLGTGRFRYRFYYISGDSADADIYSSCFNSLLKCDPSVVLSEIPAFTSYFNRKYSSALPESEMQKLLSECGTYGAGNFIGLRNTVQYSVKGCNTYMKAGDQQYALMESVNEMMRGSLWWKPGIKGYEPGDDAKRYLTIDESDFHCDSNEVDFLRPLKKFQTLVPYFSHHNYWWVYPKYAINSTVISGVGTVYDTVFINNFQDDPYFVGGFWIGAKCDNIRDSSCFSSFGDPYKKLGAAIVTPLGTVTMPTISEIDSLADLRWDVNLGEFVLSGCNRGHPNDVVTLTFRTCFSPCDQFTREEVIALPETYLTFKPGAGNGYNYMSGAEAKVSMVNDYIFPFMDMLNGLAGGGNLDNSSETDIRTLHKKYPLANYFERLIPVANAYKYKQAELNDTMLTGSLGTAGAGNVCRFVLRKWGADRSWSFGDIDVFKNLGADPEGIVSCAENGQPDMAGYYFTILAGDINGPGDTTWYELRGWNSCWQFSQLNMISGNSRILYNLPQAFTANCGCMTCPQVKEWVDSLAAEYPKLHPNHSNYPTILPNYLNRKLNTNLSFAEIQSLLDGCDMGRHVYMPVPQCDYRFIIKNTDYPLNSGIGHADTMLLIVTQQCGLGFGIDYTRRSDSTEYCLNFDGLTAAERKMVQDTIDKYFSSPYFDDFSRTAGYFRPANTDILVYSVSDDVAFSIDDYDACSKSDFETWTASENADADASTADNIIYADNIAWYDASEVSWMAKIDLSALSLEEKFDYLEALNAWAAACGNIKIKPLFYVPRLPDGAGGGAVHAAIDGHETTPEICDNAGTDEPCYTCGVFRRKVLDYQYEVAALKDNPASAMRPDSLQAWLSAELGLDLEVYSADKECLSCSDQSLLICEQPSDRLMALVELFTQVAAAKKLNNSNYSLGSGYTSLLNRIKPAGTVLSSPAWKFTANLKGGWYVTLKYNARDYDRLFFRAEDVPAQFMFNAGIKAFNNTKPDAEGGIVSNFYITSTDSLLNNAVFYVSMPGLRATACCTLPNTMLCPQPAPREYELPEPPCKEAEIARAIAIAAENYSDYVDSITRNLAVQYQLHCLNKADETFKFKQYKQRYHSTLYYYDQAGNLERTVPPAGVNELSLTSRQDSIDAYRNDISSSRFVNTQHKLHTNYRYNTLNQLVWQKTPDGAYSRFWYDRLGRLILSQNARQKAAGNVFSYTRYDALGRIIEVGEITSSPPDSLDMKADIDYFESWLSGNTARTQITKTFYDEVVMPVVNAEFPSGQQNLRNRVSAVCYYDFYAADSTQYSRATHYSYDIHGNVDRLVHDFPDMEALGHRFKHLVYDYDLISGKVHEVSYQEEKTDQWLHRYNYDADNRLTMAETSSDGVIWDRDAEYKYYKHGPLARTVIGEHAVQGVDYVYTLHGWLKGVNSNTLKTGRDAGGDGTGVLRSLTARDAYGFTLGYFSDQGGTAYFDGDYKSIGTTAFEAATAGTPLGDETRNLYNGNITHMVSAASVFANPLATAYRYDQLNRISTVKSYQDIDINDNEWNTGSLSTAYSEQFKYDANGNITTLKRYAAAGVMDQLTYHYKANTNQLTYVDDAISSSSYTDDIDDMGLGTYTYDAIGNLVGDTAEEIDTILWNVYGKITDIVRTSSSSKPGLAFKYDAIGQRVMKIVKHGPFETDWAYTWYVRDAQGNVMATYSKKQLIENDTALYRVINNALVDVLNTDSLVALIKSKFAGTQFNGALAQAVADAGQALNLMSQYQVDSLMTWDPNLAYMVASQYCNYVPPTSPGLVGNREVIYGYMWTYMESQIRSALASPCWDMNTLVTAVLDRDVSSDELLNLLATLDPTNFDNIYTDLGGSLPASVADEILFMRTNFPSSTIAAAIAGRYTITYELSTLSTGLLQSVFDPQTGSFDFCSFFSTLAGCDFNSWKQFVIDYVYDNDAQTVIFGVSDPFYLVTLALDYDPDAIDRIAGIDYGLFAEALKEVPDLDVVKYLGYIYRRFGADTYRDIINAMGGVITIKKTLTVDELHIYGSSRHGMKKPKKQLASKTYELDGISEEGQLETGSPTDSSVAVYSYHYFSRTLTYKQYELSNHLGNVLATILDRKTPEKDAVNDTLKYYTADISTATFYYAFGSPIKDFLYSDTTHNGINGFINGAKGKYRYGFNGEELESDISGDGMAYDLGARFYDSRLGRMFSLDPLEAQYPWQSPYAYCNNRPVTSVDINGMGGGGDQDAVLNSSNGANSDPIINTGGTIYISTKALYYGKDAKDLSGKDISGTLYKPAIPPGDLKKYVEEMQKIDESNGIKFNYKIISEDEAKTIGLTLGKNDYHLVFRNIFMDDPIAGAADWGNTSLSLGPNGKTLYSEVYVEKIIGDQYIKNLGSKDKAFAVAYIAKHEQLHQMLTEAALKLMGKYLPDHVDPKYSLQLYNLNTEGGYYIGKANILEILRQSTSIIAKQKELIRDYFNYNNGKPGEQFIIKLKYLYPWNQ